MPKTKLSAALAAVVAIIVSSFAIVAPAHAETDSQAANEFIHFNAQRPITNRVMKVYKGETANASYNLNQQSAAVSAMTLVAGDKITFNFGAVASNGATVRGSNTYISISGTGGAQGWITNNGTSNEITIPGDWTGVASISLNAYLSVISSKDTGKVTLTPTVSRVHSGQTTPLTVSSTSPNSAETSGFLYSSKGSLQTRTGDTRLSVSLPSVCVKVAGLTAGSVLELKPLLTGSGKAVSSVATGNWAVSTGGMPSMGASFTVPVGFNNASGKISVSPSASIQNPGAKVFDLKSFTVVKRGTTTDLVTSCGNTTAAATSAGFVANSSPKTVKITLSADTNYMGFGCTLYSTSDKTHKKALAHSLGSGQNACYFENLPTGKYSIGVRGLFAQTMGMGVSGMSSEKFAKTLNVQASRVTVS